MGRHAKTEQEKILNDNPGQRPIKRHPTTAAGNDTPPKWLDKVGKAHWITLVPVLIQNGLFGRGDEQALAMLCQAYSDYRECIKELREHGKIITGKYGEKPSPLVVMAKQYAELHTRLCDHFGLTPASRSKMTLEPLPEIDPLTEFIGD